MTLLAIAFVRTGPYLLFGLVFGVLSFMRTSRFRQRTGVSPWHVHPVIWGIISVPIWLLGTLLSVIACATTKVNGQRAGQFGRGFGAGAPGPYGGQPGYGAPPYQQGQPGYGAPPYQQGQPGYGAPPYQQGRPGAPPLPPAGAAAEWLPDPTGRHEFRYFDGTEWTEHVANDGEASTDAL